VGRVKTRLQEYHANLVQAFRVLEQKARAADGCDAVADAAQQARIKLTEQTTPGTRWALAVNPNLRVPLSDGVLVNAPGRGYLLIGGDVACERDGTVEQSIAVAMVVHEAPETGLRGICCYEGFRSRHVVLRRIHWDITGSERAAGAPVVHLQVGGKPKSFPPIPDAQSHYCAGHWIEEPRMPSLPLDFVLVVDLLLRQVDSPLRELVQEPEWNAVRQKSSELWVVPYCIAMGKLQPTRLKEKWYESIAEVRSDLS